MKSYVSFTDCLCFVVFPFLCFHGSIVSSDVAEGDCASEASVNVQLQEKRSLCLGNVGWSSVLCVYPQIL